MVLLAACDTSSFIAKGEPAVVQSVKKDASGRPFSDPLAKFVVNTSPGQSGDVFLEGGRAVRVRVGSDYVSAANEQCRHMIVQFTDGRSQANAVCFNGTVWKTVLGKL